MFSQLQVTTRRVSALKAADTAVPSRPLILATIPEPPITVPPEKDEFRPPPRNGPDVPMTGSRMVEARAAFTVERTSRVRSSSDGFPNGRLENETLK